MEEFLRRTGQIGAYRHCQVYTRAEADERGMEYVPWKDAVHAGQWGLTDDGYVVELLRDARTYQAKGQTPRSRIYFKTNYYFSCAKVWYPGGKLLWEPRRGTSCFSTVVPTDWLRAECKRLRLRNAIKAYAIMVLLVGHVDWTALGLIYRKDQRYPALTIKRMFRYDRVKKMINEEFQRLMTDSGLTPQWVIEKLKKTVETAEVKQDARSMLQAVMGIAGFLGIKPESLQRERSYRKEDYDPVEAKMADEFLLAERDVPRLAAHEEEDDA